MEKQRKLQQHGRVQDAWESVQDGLSDIFSSGSWMVVLWSFDKASGNVDLNKRITWNFPTEKFEDVLKVLRESLESEVEKLENPREPEPLPLAKHLRLRSAPGYIPVDSPDGDKHQDQDQDQDQDQGQEHGS